MWSRRVRRVVDSLRPVFVWDRVGDGVRAIAAHKGSAFGVAFSADGRHCLTQGAGPDWTLVLWNIEKSARPLCTVRTSAPPKST